MILGLVKILPAPFQHPIPTCTGTTFMTDSAYSALHLIESYWVFECSLEAWEIGWCRLQGPEMTAVLSYVAALCWSTGFTVSRSLNHWAFSLQSCRVKSQPGTKKCRDKWRESAGLIRIVTTKKSCYSTAKALSFWNLQDLRSRRRQIGFKQSRSKKSCKKLLPRKQSSWSLKAVEHAQRLPSWLSWTD